LFDLLIEPCIVTALKLLAELGSPYRKFTVYTIVKFAVSIIFVSPFFFDERYDGIKWYRFALCWTGRWRVGGQVER